MVDKEEYPFKYIHAHPEHGCGGVAYYIKNKKECGEVLYAEEAIFPDGTYPQPRDPYTCGSCGQHFEVISTEHLVANT